MNLAKFNLQEKIYIDSNIFLYVLLRNLKYVANCKRFLIKVEEGKIKAVVSPLVIDEVAFKIIVETLKNQLKLGSNIEVLRKIDRKPALLNLSKPELLTFLFIIKNYKGLRVTSAISSTGIRLFDKIIKRNLLPRDALHLSVMEHYRIKHIATNDQHFDNIPSVNVWKP